MTKLAGKDVDGHRLSTLQGYVSSHPFHAAPEHQPPSHVAEMGKGTLDCVGWEVALTRCVLKDLHRCGLELAVLYV